MRSVASQENCFFLNLSSNSLTIDVNLNSFPLTMLLDTGSSLSIINSILIEKLPRIEIQRCCVPILKLANGSAMAPLGKAEVDIDFRGIVYNIQLYIYENVPFNGLLGLDFCLLSKLSIDFNTLSKTETSLENFPFYQHLYETDTTEKNIIISVNTKIPKNTGLWVPVHSKCEISNEFSFIPDQFILTKLNLISLESLNRKTNENSEVFIVNPNNYDITLRENTKIGKFETNFQIIHEIENNIKPKDFTMEKSMVSAKSPITYNIESSLTPEQHKIVENFLNSYRDIFAKDLSELSRTHLVKHKIQLMSDKPIQKPPYRTSPMERRSMEKQVKEMLEAGIIRESHSPYSSPVVMIKKPNGTMRFCVDWRELNAITKRDSYPLPRVEDLMSAFTGSTYFSTLDMFSGYWQVPMAEEDIEKTAFVTQFGLFEFTVMGFGLNTAPETYQRMVDKLIGGLRWKICVGYLDDIIIFSPSFETQLERLDLVFKPIRDGNLKLQPEKCQFFKRQIKYLGWMVNEDGTKPDPDKVRAISNYSVPTSVKELKRFLGMVGYYRQSIKSFSHIAEPLYRLLRKSVSFLWTGEQQESFECLKQALCSAPVLCHYNPNLKVKLHCDASYDGIGYVLCHLINDQEHPFHYGSRTLSQCEMNYGVTEIECLSVVWSITRNRHFLLGIKFEVITDHHSLCWMLRAKDPSGRLCRWTLRLAEFDFTVTYKSGKSHLDVDALSRAPLENSVDLSMDQFPLYNATEIDLIKMQDSDEWCRKIKDKLLNNNQVKLGGKIFDFVEGVLYRVIDDGHEKVYQLVVPKELRKEILHTMHDDPIGGHLGIVKCYSKMRLRYFWPKMFRSVRRYINRCMDCQTKKPSPGKPIGFGQLMEVPSIPWSTMGCDLLGRFPKSDHNKFYIIVCTDHATRYVVTGALEDMKAETVAKFIIEKIVLVFGAPINILTDQGKNFTSALMQSVLHTMSTTHIRTSAYHPQTNAVVENFNKTLANGLSMYCNDDQTNWPDSLPYITFSYNTVEHQSTGFSPYRLLYGREPRYPIDALLRAPVLCQTSQNFAKTMEESRLLANEFIKNAQLKNKIAYDLKRTDNPFKVGDKVLVFTPIRKVGKSEKLLHRYFGPFTIQEFTSPVNVRVISEVSNRKDIVHISRLKRYEHEFDENIDENITEEISPIITEIEPETAKPSKKVRFQDSITEIESKEDNQLADSPMNDNISTENDKSMENIQTPYLSRYGRVVKPTQRYGFE